MYAYLTNFPFTVCGLWCLVSTDNPKFNLGGTLSINYNFIQFDQKT